MRRSDGRSLDQMRALRFIPHYSKFSAGSVLVEWGDTKVICAVACEEGVPNFLRNSVPSQGWLTAEYSMLPSSTNSRTRRERPMVSGRTQEIQRLIGRSLRGIIDLKALPEITLTVDCDVIQADGGTRTAAITGGYIALKLALDKLMRQNRVKQNPLNDSVAAISLGLFQDQILVDLNYEEDSKVDVDLNIVMTASGKLLEIQGTAEKRAFSKEQLIKVIDNAQENLQRVIEAQLAACEGREVEI